MPTFRLSRWHTEYQRGYVEAKSKEAAIERAYEDELEWQTLDCDEGIEWVEEVEPGRNQ